MTTVHLVALTLALLCLFSCGTAESDKELRRTMDEADLIEIPSKAVIDRTKESHLPGFQDSSCENLLLQISTEQSGMVFPQGKLLDIRILRSGDAEYDLYGNSDVILRKTMMVSGLTLENFTTRINSNEFAGLKPEYFEGTACIDSTLTKEIIFCPKADSMKRAVTVTYCYDASKTPEQAPHSLTSLMMDVRKLSQETSE